jgi:hypothetical protein
MANEPLPMILRTNRLYSFNGKTTTILEVLPLYSVEVSTCHVEQVRIL